MFKQMFRADAAGYWPRAAMVDILRQTNDEVIADDYDAERHQHIYRVTLSGLTYLTVFIHAPGHEDKITGFGFLAIFTGFDLTPTGLEGLNRSLHVSVAERESDDDVLLFSFFEPRGSFDANRFAAMVQAWHRDLIMTLKMLMPEASFASNLSARVLNRARKVSNARDVADYREPVAAKPPTPAQAKAATAPMLASAEPFLPTEPAPGDPRQMKTPTAATASANSAGNLAHFIGLRVAQRDICQQCEGRGRTGFPKRTCSPCEGSGLTGPVKRSASR
ncbi:MAG: hypothetical protein AAFY83_03875 [Pseudomonadota bacterium]